MKQEPLYRQPSSLQQHLNSWDKRFKIFESKILTCQKIKLNVFTLRNKTLNHLKTEGLFEEERKTCDHFTIRQKHSKGSTASEINPGSWL